MTRILFVSSEGRLGGAETSLLLHVRSLDPHFAPSVACPVPSPLAQALAAGGIETHALPPPPSSYRSRGGLAWWWVAVRRLVTATRRVRPDLIHANTFYAGAAALLAALVTRRKLVVHARDLADFGVLVRWYGRHADRLIAVSEAVRKSLVSRGVRSDKIEVVPNGLDLAIIRFPGADPETLAPRPAAREAFIFAHVGQFAPWKNHDIFIRATEQVARDLPQAQFVIVGDDLSGRNSLYKRTLYYRARYCAAADRIHFWGWRTDMENVWPAVDCLVHTAETEAFGRVIIEAMAHGIPVIAADRGGPAEILQADRTGVLVPPRDVEALRRAMLRVARDAPFARELAAAGCRYVRSHFAASRTTARMQEIYEGILSA
jgi:glycosyltransferase involved in cell wall biosynthesis